MMDEETTQFPNTIIDIHLHNLSGAEYKVLSIIIRQTNGWVDKRTGTRKVLYRISHSQFMKKTGLCRRVVSTSLQNLVNRGLVTVGDREGWSLHRAEKRKGMSHLYYGLSQAPQGPRTYRVRGIGDYSTNLVLEPCPEDRASISSKTVFIFFRLFKIS